MACEKEQEDAPPSAGNTATILSTNGSQTPSPSGKTAAAKTPSPEATLQTAVSSASSETGTASRTLAPTPTQTKTQTPKPTAAPTPTPNAYNGNTNLTEGKIIEFSHPSGYYDAPFTLKLSYDSSYKVYYTLNGNTPTTSSKAYTSSGIAVNDLSSDSGKDDDVIVIRAAAFKNGTQVGTAVTPS